jgi:hypothetical protein
MSTAMRGRSASADAFSALFVRFDGTASLSYLLI